ncbi:MAG: hypothetical protein QOF27_2716 [Gaiellaceae bacterium]|jgi:hypothetical protein|nr:hypothetical protein [Gaiellaceae bacterium]
MDDQIVAGARDAAKELGYDVTGTSVCHQPSGGTAYGFAFDAHGYQARVELIVTEADVARLGLTWRDYARWEILDALRELPVCAADACEHAAEIPPIGG